MKMGMRSLTALASNIAEATPSLSALAALAALKKSCRLARASMRALGPISANLLRVSSEKHVYPVKILALSRMAKSMTLSPMRVQQFTLLVVGFMNAPKGMFSRGKQLSAS